jgi:hypothetical protein
VLVAVFLSRFLHDFSLAGVVGINALPQRSGFPFRAVFPSFNINNPKKIIFYLKGIDI